METPAVLVKTVLNNSGDTRRGGFPLFTLPYLKVSGSKGQDLVNHSIQLAMKNDTLPDSKRLLYPILPGLIAVLLCVAVWGGCSGDGMDGDPPQPEVAITGSVKDENGNPYPKTLVTLSKGTAQLETRTNTGGTFEFDTEEIGTHQITMVLPLSTTTVTANPVSVNLLANQTSTVNFVVQAQPVVAHLNVGNVDILGEIKDSEGDIPTDPDEPLYARNVFDAPIGLLTAIETPDDHHVTLSEWETAQGEVRVHCNGNLTLSEIDLQGMIPNGTYTLWLNFLNTVKQPGETINPSADLVKIEPLGSGTSNIAVADGSGRIEVTILHPSCMLTEEVALVMPVIYHINGNTYGSAHIPDAEEVVHMLVYFQ